MKSNLQQQSVGKIGLRQKVCLAQRAEQLPGGENPTPLLRARDFTKKCALYFIGGREPSVAELWVWLSPPCALSVEQNGIAPTAVISPSPPLRK